MYASLIFIIISQIAMVSQISFHTESSKVQMFIWIMIIVTSIFFWVAFWDTLCSLSTLFTHKITYVVKLAFQLLRFSLEFDIATPNLCQICQITLRQL